MEKVTCKISALLSALQLALDEMPDIQEVILVLGGSLIRPQHVYQLVFNGGKLDFGRATESTKSKVADFIAKKVGLLCNYIASCSFAFLNSANLIFMTSLLEL